MALQLKSLPRSVPTPIASPARPIEAPASTPLPMITQPAAPCREPAGLRSDRIALLIWLGGAGIMGFMLLKDLVVALFSW